MEIKEEVVDLGIETVEAESDLNKHSPSDVKIDLFMSLFLGRSDIYARRWQSAKTGKSGYQPVCGNEWDAILCDKQKYKCNACPNRRLLPIDTRAIVNHLSGKDLYGRDVIGIYPMLDNETCRFLAVDFDDDNFERDALAFKQACTENDVAAYIERSHSGNGAHIWIFFSDPVEAKLARKMGSGLLTDAMNRQSHIRFNSYDRFFPNQDTMPTGGFGNLISLPLQGLARKNANSVFVNDDFIPFDDQWAYLSQVKRMTSEQVQYVVDRLCPHNELGILVKDTEEKQKPWEAYKEAELNTVDFPPIINIVRANMIYIPKSGLSHKAINRIRRLAAFKNPDFYRSQAMRLPIYDKPRIICTADENEQYIGLPRGCEDAVCMLLNDCGVSYTIDDKTNSGKAISVSFNGTLRNEQQPAADAMLEHTIGVLSATTAFGKTVIGSYLISQRKVNTLVLVHTGALLSQWKKSLSQFLSIEAKAPETEKKRGRKKVWSTVGALGSGKNSLSGIVDVAIMQSLFDGDDVKELVQNYGMIIVDECHHVSAVNFEKILRYANTKYVYGLSATPVRADGHHPIIFMQCGPLCYVVDAKSQAEKRSFTHTVIPRFTSFRCLSSEEKSITQIYSELASSEMRNRQITDEALTVIQQNRTPIILTERREHANALAAILSDKCLNVITLIGTMSAKDKCETMTRLESIPATEPLIIVASGKYVGEGFDFPRLDTLLLAMPIAWKGKVAQYAGRLHRAYEGKTEVRIYDYIDIHVSVLERMYQKRVKSYASIGYEVRATEQNAEKASIIYNGKNFLTVYYNDIESANHEITIVSPSMRKNRLLQMANKLQPMIKSGIRVTVVIRPSEDYREDERESVNENSLLLTEAGIKVVFRSGFHQKFTVIDNNTVWYGSVNFLSFGTNEESIMRLESNFIATQLLETVDL